MHHRRNRSQGGGWSPSNILHLCVESHVFVTEHPAEAVENGWSVRGRCDSWSRAVLRRDVFGERRLVFLNDDGSLEAAVLEWRIPEENTA